MARRKLRVAKKPTVFRRISNSLKYKPIYARIFGLQKYHGKFRRKKTVEVMKKAKPVLVRVFEKDAITKYYEDRLTVDEVNESMHSAEETILQRNQERFDEIIALRKDHLQELDNATERQEALLQETQQHLKHIDAVLADEVKPMPIGAHDKKRLSQFKELHNQHVYVCKKSREYLKEALPRFKELKKDLKAMPFNLDLQAKKDALENEIFRIRDDLENRKQKLAELKPFLNEYKKRVKGAGS